MNDEWSQVAANSVAHEARMASAAIQRAAAQHERPSVLYRPSLSLDGNQWCALYGENLQDGVAGFGSSPAAAMFDFDAAWYRCAPVTPLLRPSVPTEASSGATGQDEHEPGAMNAQPAGEQP